MLELSQHPTTYGAEREQAASAATPTPAPPAPLETVGDLVIIHIYHMHDSDWFGQYHESAVQITKTMPETPCGDAG